MSNFNQYSPKENQYSASPLRDTEDPEKSYGVVPDVYYIRKNLRVAQSIDFGGGLYRNGRTSGAFDFIAPANIKGDIMVYDAEKSTVARLAVGASGTVLTPDTAERLGMKWYQLQMTDLANTDLADPDADRIVFWDDSDGRFEFLVPNTGLAISGNNLNVTNVPVSALANGTDGELITWGADATPTTVGVGTAGQVLTSNGAGAAPTFQDATGGGSMSHYIVNPPFPDMTLTTQQLDSNTTLWLYYFWLPAAITVNHLTINVASVATAGSLHIAIFSDDGQTREISITTASIAATAYEKTSVSAASLDAGGHWFAIMTNGTTDLTVRCFQPGSVSDDDFFWGITGENDLAGLLSVTASTMPSTITPSSIVGSAGDDQMPIFRLDN